MKLPLFDAPAREPSASVGFAGNRIDRQSENRSADAASQALANPDARIYLIAGVMAGTAGFLLFGEHCGSYFRTVGSTVRNSLRVP